MNQQQIASAILEKAAAHEFRRDIIPPFLRKPTESSEILTSRFIRTKCQVQQGQYYEPWGVFTGVLLDSDNRHYLRFFASHAETTMPFTKWLELNAEERHEQF